MRLSLLRDRHRAHSEYAHRGAAERGRQRVRHIVLLLGLFGAVALLPRQRASDASASAVAQSLDGSRTARLQQQLDAVAGELELANARLARANAIIGFSTKYRVGAGLAGEIYDAALAQGVDPALAFRLVSVESEFKERATSPVGAVGLTQLMPATARLFERGIAREALYDRSTNLRIGLRYLRILIRQYDGNISKALLAYNGGPAAAERSGQPRPASAYDRLVLRGYRGTGVIE